jgi:hypothetical protein
MAVQEVPREQLIDDGRSQGVTLESLRLRRLRVLGTLFFRFVWHWRDVGGTLDLHWRSCVVVGERRESYTRLGAGRWR